MRPLLTVPEVAAILRCSARKVRTWIAARVLKAVRLGRLVRIRQEDLERFVERGAR
jgi:excisionase family DNA binding protein